MNIEVVLAHCDIFNNQYLNDSWLWSIFVPNKSYSQLLNISPVNHIYAEKFRSEFSYIELSFTCQNSRHLEIKDRMI